MTEEANCKPNVRGHDMADHRYTKYLAVLVVGIVLLGASVSVGGCGARPSMTMDASWVKLYHDIGSLKKASDVAVDGSIAGIASQISVSQTQVPTTDFTFAIQQ